MKKQGSLLGFYGNTAITSKALEKEISGKSVTELLEMGQYKVAYIVAKNNNNDTELQQIADTYNKLSGSNYTTSQLNTLFGVHFISDENQKTKAL